MQDNAIEFHSTPELHDPVLIVAVEGWIDAGVAANAAIDALFEQLNPTKVATFDPEVFIDYRARRPTMHLRDGVNTGLTWPEITLWSAQDRHGRDLLILRGHEPDAQWKRFCNLMTQYSLETHVTMMIALGAYPVGVPHTRPAMMSCTASSAAIANSTGLIRNSLDVPAGITAALERTLADGGIESLGLWAQIPHYAAGMPYPGGALVLLTNLARITGLAVDLGEVQIAATAQAQRLDELIARSSEHQAMVSELERAYDTMVATESPLSPPGTPLPSGDELAAELERFLREQPEGPGGQS
jgi:proteasome assembly chaperone (PAC2) family protein